MSWAADEWKDGLPARALQKIQQLEAQNEKVRKNSEQKQFQLDSLEQVIYVNDIILCYQHIICDICLYFVFCCLVYMEEQY